MPETFGGNVRFEPSGPVARAEYANRPRSRQAQPSEAFIALTTAGETIFALDKSGGVWRYAAAFKDESKNIRNFACWEKLTDYRRAETER